MSKMYRSVSLKCSLSRSCPLPCMRFAKPRDSTALRSPHGIMQCRSSGTSARDNLREWAALALGLLLTHTAATNCRESEHSETRLMYIKVDDHAFLDFPTRSGPQPPQRQDQVAVCAPAAHHHACWKHLVRFDRLMSSVQCGRLAFHSSRSRWQESTGIRGSSQDCSSILGTSTDAGCAPALAVVEARMVHAAADVD